MLAGCGKSRQRHHRVRSSCLASLGLLLQSQLGCYYHDDEGETGPLPPAAEPSIVLFDYAVTDVATGATYANGCTWAPYLSYADSSISARVPLEIEYLLEFKSMRVFRGQSYVNQPTEDLCQLRYDPFPLQHTNPSCYDSVNWSNTSELLEASLSDASGNTISFTNAWIEGTSTDIEKFKLISHSSGAVEISTGLPPCGNSAAALTLIHIKSL